ncbi:glutamine synthetase family protein [Paeniglutamicibacter cryotolerans]|uniref:Glutamine synthetase n=1 Tax=Paeniglutamicibacter cryotolerans TaxID=670079 RepID=A0A839QKT1_9MICC|nr:glutamine synthetase family protein [Paeniglutamicibacter cryotolerans]MBB2995185.1 glutamine synthetase [Paeniglutamicibacter cryotolerans]
MNNTELAFIATNDLGGQTRGRSMWLDEVDLDSGCGWVPANLGIGPFGKIIDDSGFGSQGDLRLVPDPASATRIEGIPGRPPMTLFMSDIKHTDGRDWACCPRSFLREAINDFRTATGLELYVAFEHEFMMVSDEAPEPPFSFQALRRMEPLGTGLMNVLRDAGMEPETWLPEYGEHQWELTVRPSDPLMAADRAVMLREIIRDFAHATGQRASFAPVLEPQGSGNGVHVHFSFRDGSGAPAMYEAGRPGNMSALTGAFAAGVLGHARALVALSAPSDISYLRLAPHNWSSASSFLGERNREALLRICPTIEIAGRNPESQYNLEFRAGDATSNPWILLGTLIRSGLDGILRELDTPFIVDTELEELNDEQQQAAGITPLPSSLPDALAALAADETVSGFFDPQLLALHHAIKADEIRQLAGLTDTEKCARYAAAY